MRVAESGRDPDLAQESLGADGRGEVWMQYFHRDRAVVPGVARKENGSHTAAADLSLDFIAAEKGSAYPIRQVRHGWYRTVRLREWLPQQPQN